MMEKYGEDWETVFSEYEKSRRQMQMPLPSFRTEFFRNEF
jgi:hypothetical protein